MCFDAGAAVAAMVWSAMGEDPYTTSERHLVQPAFCNYSLLLQICMNMTSGR